MQNTLVESPQISLHNRSNEKTIAQNWLECIQPDQDTVTNWMAFFFEYGPPVSESSRREKERDIRSFIDFMIRVDGGDLRIHWSPRLSGDFIKDAGKQITEKGKKRYSNRTINRKLATLRHFAKWVHKFKPFPLDNPMAGVKDLKVTSLLDVDRALTKQQYRLMLDYADRLLVDGGLSKDRNRYKNVDKRPRRKTFRPYRNRAIIYTIADTGMRCFESKEILLENVDFRSKKIKTTVKGGGEHEYQVRQQALDTIREYIKHERPIDFEHYQSPYLFLPAKGGQNKTGQLSRNAVHKIWNPVRDRAGIPLEKTPHCARHAMGKHIQNKTKNAGAIQRQLGQKNIAYALCYARETDEEMDAIIEER